MRNGRLGRPALGALLVLVLGGAGYLAVAAIPDPLARRAGAQKDMQAGNFNDAYEAFRALALDAKTDPAKAGEDLTAAVECLQRLGRTSEADALREKAAETHAGNWRLLQAAARSYQQQAENWGFVVAGEFYRGGHRGEGGRQVSSLERDRVRAMQLMLQAMPLAQRDANAPGGDDNALAEFYFAFADLLLDDRFGNGAWRLQSLTDTAAPLPDYDEDMATVFGRRRHGGRGFRGSFVGGSGDRGAPVNEDGTPLFHKLPASWEAATSDGERWRWCLAEAGKLGPFSASRARFTLAQFLQRQFDVTTMAPGYGGFRPLIGVGGEAGLDDGGEGRPEETGPFAVSTLGEDETIARLATGVKRFKLPDEFNFIRIYQELLAANGDYAEHAHDYLAMLFEDRQQYPRAAEYWRTGIALRGDQNFARSQRLRQIVGNWCTFEAVPTAPAGRKPRLPLLYRNGKRVSFEAWAIDVPRLLDDVKAYLKGGPNQIDWNRVQVDTIGYQIVQNNQKQYLRERVAAWDADLRPRDKHFDRRTWVQTPLEKPGAYLVTATMADGNTSNVVVWVADTTIVKKSLDGGSYYFVADAATGQPVRGAKLEFFGWRQEHLGDNKFKTHTETFAKDADADGQLRLAPAEATNGTQWLVTATAGGGRFAFHGFTGIWSGSASQYEQEYGQQKAFTITDRPVYRPGQAVKFKAWVGQAKYDAEGKSPYAGQPFTVLITNPKGDKVLEKQFTADAFGGFDGEVTLDGEATLGAYSIALPGIGGGSFRVEEYKKPEFEVTVDAPAEPVMLGERITATIRSKYYFGSPVTGAKVKYKVLRSRHAADWYPPGAWDWFYGKGYWWFGQDYAWYPGWGEWGCRAPVAWWWNRPQEQPEVVSENEVSVGPDGTVKVEIDTAAAKAAHGDADHRYEIMAEVTDQSRRTIVGTGTVSVARKPFKVYAWVDRGHYRQGETVEAGFAAQTVDGKPVKGSGELKLLAVEYDAKLRPTERVVETWAVSTDDAGRAAQKISAANPGQYRLSYTVTDGKKHAIEGGYVFVVRGHEFDGREFRFNDVEIVADKREYAPGERVRLMINTARPDSTVVLFVRPSNGIYLAPKVIRMTGKSTVEEVEVATRDMPNFFVEAFTVADGKVFEQTRELVVPPANRVVNVEVLPGAERSKPGGRATIKVRLTDGEGEPVVGSAVLSLYDKSVEYVSGGSNVPDIQEFFWKWRRSHYPHTETSLSRVGAQVAKPGEQGFGYLGRFGHLVSQLPLGETEALAASDPAMPADEVQQFALAPASQRPMGGPSRLRGAAAMKQSLFARSEASELMDGAADFGGGGGGGGGGGDDATPRGAGFVEPTVRKNFADTALWVANLGVKDDGVAEVELDMPENLTTWKARVWVMSAGTRVGQGQAEIVTAKDLIVRLQAPRFFVQKDEVVLSANVHNYLKSPKRAEVTLQLEGGCLEPLVGEGQTGGLVNEPNLAASTLTQTVHVEPGGEQRVDFRVRVASPGSATVRMLARTDEESDATQMSFPVYVHGMLKTESFAGAIRPSASAASVSFTVPQERIPEQSRVEIRYSPSVAGAMVDALPYLTDFPYGCTEQTLNRFLPTVITQRVLIAMGLNLKDIAAKRTNLNAQEIGDDRARAAARQNGTRLNPVFDEAVVLAMTRAGVTKLANQQLPDGGWGWFSGYGEQSGPHTTATVVHGLQIARANDVALPPGVLERGVEWLKLYEARQVQMLKNAPGNVSPSKNASDNLDAFVFMVLSDAGHVNGDMREFLYRDRSSLSVYCLAQLGLALHRQKGQEEKLAMVLRNLSQYVVQDEENQTAYLKLPESGRYWWYWYGSDTEANAYYLKLLAKTDGKGELPARLAKYLVNSRRNANYWNSTRDTALCVEALADFIAASGEGKPDMKVAVQVDGKVVKEVAINAANLFSFDNKVVLEGPEVTPGAHRIEFTRTGTGPLYFNAYVTNFTLEEPITKAGLEIRVQRKYYRLVPVDKTVKVSGLRGQAVGQKVEAHRREPLADGDTLTGGDLVEVELEIDSKNDYEYVLFEDMKASGFEPVDTQSGYNGNDLNAYMELRDERVCFFTRSLARGKHSVAYRLRAEVPGAFHALPTRAGAMYAPELRANSDEGRLNIRDAGTDVDPTHAKATQPAGAATPK